MLAVQYVLVRQLIRGRRRTSDSNPVVKREYKITSKYRQDHPPGQEASTHPILALMIDAGAEEYYCIIENQSERPSVGTYLIQQFGSTMTVN